VLPSQNALVQSPPQTHGPPNPLGAQTPATHEPLVQSVSKPHTPVAQFAWQIPPWQFWLVQSPPQLQAPPMPTG
jgi:hypothetical protein